MPEATQIEYKSTLYDIKDASATTKLEELSNGGDFFKKIGNYIYPIGSIYIANDNKSPETIFGGSWVRLSNGLLKATRVETETGTASGTDQITLTTENLPSHDHSTGVLYQRVEPAYAGQGDINLLQALGNSKAYTGKTGSGKPFTINPRHWKVAVWVRNTLYEG